jgi:hypothetical protein
MTGNDIRMLSIDRYPEPACSYTIDGDRAVLQASNQQFEAISGLGAGDQLGDLFENGLSAVESRPTFRKSTRLWVEESDNADGKPYLVRVIPPAEDRPGHLLFSEEYDTGPRGFGVDRVASVISHDLRNPLDVARARLRAGRELDSEEHFDHVEQAHDRMERIIQDVLTLARGEDVVNPEERVELDALAREAWKTVETNGAELEVEAELPTVLADRDRVSRLFENLFRNSVEHAIDHSSGAASVVVTVGRLPDGFFVADDGTGIPEHERDHIFEAGYTSDDHGTGLGLAIVARIANLHGWTVSAEDSPDGGARFEFTNVESE